jgi:CubicO group peptidase (beta-lactamase class C family)
MPRPTRRSMVRGVISRFRLLASVLALAGIAIRSVSAADYSGALTEFQNTIEVELSRGIIRGVSVALVQDQEILLAKGFGFADKQRRIPAQADTIYRAGSISKLFTALAAMQLAERGALDIDQPVTRWLPEFRIVNPSEDGQMFTLRQLMCHRSGMVREAPVGGYFDDTEPTAEATVASLASCVLVYLPNTKTKYSNSGVTIVGQAVARVACEPFAEYQQRHLLGPIGMNSSAFLMNRRLHTRLAKGYLPVADGRGGFREIKTPHFELGTTPAGNLYTTAEDLARFLSFLFAGGRSGTGQLIKAETLKEMFTPQLTKATNGFGLGFNVGWFRGRKTVNHTGAVYGFTSLVSGLPDEKLGVVVLCNDDIAVAPVRRLGAAGLSALLDAKTGEKATPSDPPLQLPATDLAALAGAYESESWWAEVTAGPRGLEANVSGQRMTLQPIKPLEFVANGRLALDSPVLFECETAGQVTGFSALGQKFRRIDPRSAPPLPESWKKFLGSYGPAFIPLIVSARHGHLYAMTENEYDNRLTPLNRTVFKMPPGLYTDEQLVFQLDRSGRPHTAVLANMPLKRRKGP